jgi:hypothetical protein
MYSSSVQERYMSLYIISKIEGGALGINLLLLQIKTTQWPESASELERPPLVGEVSVNFCG